MLADGYGNVVHLGERECSLQRRHQKVIEEAPSPLLDAATRARIGAAACDTARSVDYTGAGTVEFIVSADRPDEFFFMEMNTRLQVEHPVTEMVTGLDLVEQQVRVAAGEKLPIAQDDVTHDRARHRGPGLRRGPRARLPADRRRRCSTSPSPTGPGVRVDSGLARGTVVGSDYDPMLAKVIAHADDRAAALRALDRALADTAVLGVTTNIEFLRFLLADPDVVAGRLDTGLLDRRTPDFAPAAAGRRRADRRGRRTSGCAAGRHRRGDLWDGAVGLADRASARRPRSGCTPASAPTTCTSPAHRKRATAAVEDGETHTLTATLDGDRLAVTLDGLRTDYLVAAADGADLAGAGTAAPRWSTRFGRHPCAPTTSTAATPNSISPMPGSVVAVGVEDGAHVDAGAVVVAVEAMKMEHALTAPGRRRGRTTRRRRRPGQGGPAAGPHHRHRDEEAKEAHDRLSGHRHAARRLRAARQDGARLRAERGRARSPPSTTTSTPSRTRWSPGWPRWACSGCRSPRSTAAWAATTSRCASRSRNSAGSTRAWRSRWRPACRWARCRSTGSAPRSRSRSGCRCWPAARRSARSG